MENKNQNGTLLSEGPEGVTSPPAGALHTPPSDVNDLSLEPNSPEPLIMEKQPKGKVHRFLRVTRRLDVVLAALLLIAGAVVLFSIFSKNNHPQENSSSSAVNRFGTVKIPLGELLSGKDLSLLGSANVTINGSMQLNNSLLLSPSVQPAGAKPGQLYYDQATNELAYFNGQTFVFLTSPQASNGGVQSLGGGTGQLTLGSGLSLTNGQLSNNGVLSVQGQAGDVTFTAGAGLVINGTTFSNSGVLTVASGSPNVVVTNDGNGGVTVSVTGGGGSVTSAGGTAGRVPLFTTAQNIEDSIISQSGLTVTISGDLSVVTGGLSLSNALTVSNGGTGATSFANNGVLVGQGTGAFAAVAAGGAGLCLISTGGLPSWGACPGSGGVTSLNGLSGGLSIANASGAGSTITIDNASTVAKGIASFNATNFTVSSGAVNTIQNINTGATPTFAGLNTNSITPSAALTVGATTQSLTLQGSAATTVTATNGANTTALAFVTPTANVTYRLQTASAGTYDVCTTAGNCVASGAVTTPGGTTNRLAKFSGSQIIGDSIVVDNGSNVDVGGTLSVQGNATFIADIAVNGGDITSSGALNITPGGTLTVGLTGQQLTLQGNASSTLTVANGINTTTLTFQAPTANVTYRLPTATAGTYDLCTTVGNCAGSGGGVTTSGGTPNRLAKFSGTQSIDNSTISDNGTNVTTSVNLIIQGGNVTLGVANSQTGSINLAHSGSAFSGTILQGALTGDRTYTLPDINGTLCLSSGNCSGSGSSNTLQAAYDAGNTITTATNRDISFTLADSATDANFIVTAATGSTGYVGIVRADGAGTADPAQLLLLSNLDTDRIQPVGLKIQSASGGMTTAIDVSDPAIVTAINIGTNDIVGSTGNITLSNFGVAGTTGNVTTSGTLNGQTISSAASFTGTVAVAGNTTLAGDIAVNGGDITSSGALNITPGGTLTVGVAGQQLVLQGNATTQLAVTGGGFTTTVGFAGTPTGTVNYNFDRAATAGAYTICTNIGNCASSGGGVTTTGGTTGAIAKFTGAQTLGNSLLSESGSTVTVNGNLNLMSGNQFQVNGTQISSGNLSNDANLAKLSASQTFAGNTVAFQNGTNSSNAFNVQNSVGNRIFTVDSASALVTLGTASTLDGKLVFSNVSNANTVTVLPGAPTANRTLTLPDASGIICTDSGNCVGAGATLQTAYNFSVGGITPKIKVNSSLGGVDIQDADTPTGANLLNIRQSNGAGLGSVMFGVGNTGAVTLQNSANSTTAFRLLTAGGTSVLVGDTTNGQILLGQSNTLTGTIVFRNASNASTVTLTSATPTAGRTINLPDADGTICLTSGNCSGSGSSNTLQAAYDAGNTITTTTARNILFSLADTATDANFLVDLQCDTSCGTNGRFAIQDDGTDTFSIGPSGATLYKNSVNSTTAFRVQNAAGTNTVLNVDTTNGYIGINNAAPSYALDVTGGMRLTGSSALIHMDAQDNSGNFFSLYSTAGELTFASGLNVRATLTAAGNLGIGLNYTPSYRLDVNSDINTQTQYRVNGVVICTSAGCTPSAGSSNYIQNTATTQTNANIAIQSAADASVSLFVKERSTQSADLLRVVDSNNVRILSLDAFGTMHVDNKGEFLGVVGIGNTASSGQQLRIATASDSTIGLTIDGTTSQTGDLFQLNKGASQVLVVGGSGSTLFKNASNSTTALRVQDAAGATTVLDVDTSNARVGIGIAAPTEALDVSGNINIPTTSATVGVIKQNGSPLIHTLGTNNFFAGPSNGNLTLTASQSTGVGSSSLTALTSGVANSSLGYRSLQTVTSGGSNTAVGVNTLQVDSTGGFNSAFGASALQNTTVNDNNAFGAGALSANTTGTHNAAFGSNALTSNTTGVFNTASGDQGLFDNTTGNRNTSLGFNAGRTSVAANTNTTGSENTFLGFESGPASSTQRSNATAIGAHATINANDSIALGCINGVNGCSATTKVGVANTAPGFLLHVGSSSISSGTTVARFENAGGTCSVTPNTAGGITCTSDQRLKKNIQGFSGALDIINQIDVKQYNMLADKDGAQKQIGVIAQQVEKVLPGLVVTDSEGWKSMSYSGLTPVLLQAIKEQQQQIDELQKAVGQHHDGTVAGASTGTNTSWLDTVRQWAPMGVVATLLAVMYAGRRRQLMVYFLSKRGYETNNHRGY